MTEDCKLCGRPCLESHDLYQNKIHMACYDERNRRFDAGLCTKCGENYRVAGYNRCQDCTDDPIGFKGYPGP